MIVLLPYAHERQTVQRLPYVTFTLIALNVVIFLLTHFGGSSIDVLLERLESLQSYAMSHPYLDIPPEGREYFETYQLEHLEILKAATNMSDLDPERVREEQGTLNSLVQDVKEVENSNPYGRYGYIPAKPSVIGLFSCMFIHGGWLHLLGNMFFLYLAGCSIEDLWGRPLYIGFYLISGISATIMHALRFPTDAQPLIGASGAIAGLMGAFMVRLHNTKISFFYMIWFWVRGTFRAPAYIMLPLWLLQQFFYAMLDEQGEGGVAFWAHIGGFVFGALFAFALKKYQIEEKYIAPKIETKVGLAQHPDYLRAMGLSEEGKYSEAQILLHRVVREDPNHLEAYMEMRRIAEINKDPATYTKYSTAIFEILIRTRDWDLLLDLYRQYQASPLRQPLPPKSLFGLGNYFEETLDYQSAADHFEELVAAHPGDPLSMKAGNKLARLYLEKINDREKGIHFFWQAYHHPNADSQWRAALQTDIKKYQIPEKPAPAAQQVSAIPPPVPVPIAFVPMGFNDPHESLPEESPVAATSADVIPPLPRSIVPDDSTQAVPAVIPPLPVPAPVLPPSPKVAMQRATGEKIQLPNSVFDGELDSQFIVVPVKLEKIGLKGLEIRNQMQTIAILPWKKVLSVSVGKLRIMDPSLPASQQSFVLVDLIGQRSGINGAISYRIQSDQIAFDKIFPMVEQTFDEAFQNFMGIVLTNSGARCMPNRESCFGPNFAVYPDVSRYESRLREKLQQ